MMMMIIIIIIITEFILLSSKILTSAELPLACAAISMSTAALVAVPVKLVLLEMETHAQLKII